MTFTIDVFSENDKQDCLALWDLANPWSKENNRPDIPEANWQDVVSQQGPLYGLALRQASDGKLVGYILYFFCPSIRNVRDECEIRDIFVLPEFRRQGGGTLLMKAVHEKAREHDAGRIFWAVNALREDSIAFMSTFGAEEKTERTYYLWLNTKVKAVA